jgi:hypothetical protein
MPLASKLCNGRPDPLCARWSAPEYLQVDERFTPLRVHVPVRENAEPLAEKQALPFDTLAEAMTVVFDEQMAPASVIFAPPGGGKSTLLRHHQLQQARRLTEAKRLVFYAQLRDYCRAKRAKDGQEPEQPALARLESEWRRETGQAPPLETFMRQGSLTLLLDGLNEIPHDSDGAYRARVGEWQALVDAVDDRYPDVSTRLPELPSTGWEETALMATSLSERPEAFIRTLAPANLALAGLCAAQPAVSISDRLCRELQTLLIARTQDPQADLRARIAAGKALGELGDPRMEARLLAGVKLLLPTLTPHSRWGVHHWRRP